MSEDRYIFTDVHVTQQMVAYVEFVQCTDCGVPVLDTDQHDDFHTRLNATVERLDLVEKVASRARSRADMHRPIG